MRRAAGLLLIVVGTAVLALGLQTGRVSVALLLIVPVFYSSSPELFVSALLMMAGLLLQFVIGAHREDGGADGSPRTGTRFSPEEGRVEAGGRGRPRTGAVIMVGPLPVVWGSDRRIALVALLLALLLMVVLAFYRPFGGYDTTPPFGPARLSGASPLP